MDVTRDRYAWRPKKRIEFAPGMTLDWEISYDWPEDIGPQKKIPQDDVVVIMNFRFEELDKNEPLRKPERTWFHLYRSQDPEKEQSFTANSLIDIMFWHKNSNGSLDTKALMPLGALLGFGTGYDTLVWNIRSEPNLYGGTQVAAKGILPIAAMKNKAAKIPKLRRQLEKKAANFRTQCPLILTAPMTVSGP